MYSKWDNFELPQLTENNYGTVWPRGTAQVTKELSCFKSARMGKSWKGLMPAFYHFLNVQRLLFPHIIDLYKDVKKGRIWNNYYMDIAETLCEFESATLTGPASANKTYCVSSFIMTCFMSAPNETLAMLSTTSGAASERRIWADIKDMHSQARYEECGIQKIGEVIDYVKSVVYDEGKELGNSLKNNRDFRNGITVIPIATDSTGDRALATIQGSKNRFVYWVLDEMAHMNPGVTRPNGNLNNNPHYMFIGIGNANDPTDPHGEDCMPKGGLEALNLDTDRRWTSARGRKVLFLHGKETPNNHPFVDKDSIKKVTDYPFPYATNDFASRQTAIEYGNGDEEEGRQTTDFWKFCIGFWPPANSINSLYTTSLFKNFKADQPCERLVSGIRNFGGGDFAFSVGGDSSSFYTIKFGYTANSEKRLDFAKHTKNIRSKAQDKDEFNRQIAKGFVNEIDEAKIRYKDFGADTGNDAALTLNEMSRIARTHDFVGISSIGKAGDPNRYDNKVTELWFKARDLIRTGLCRGINLQSSFINQLCLRKYQSLGKNKYRIEKKEDMKKRIGRSPDDADAFIYACWMVIKSGLFDEEIAESREVLTEEEEREQEELMRGPSRWTPNKSIEEQDFQLTEDREEYSELW